MNFTIYYQVISEQITKLEIIADQVSRPTGKSQYDHHFL